MHFPRLALVVLTCFLFSGRITSAQNNVTNLLTFCSEDDLISAFAQGGNWFMDCGTNVVLIRLTRPLVAETTNPVSIFTTNQVVITGSNTTRLMVIRTNAHVVMGGFSFFSGRQTATNENNGGIDDTAGGAVYIDGGTFEAFGGRFEGNSAVGFAGSAGEAGTGENGEDGGDAAGGAIYNNHGTLNLSNVVFVSNVTTGGAGGNGGSGRTSGFGMSGGNGGNGGSAGGSAVYSEKGSNHIVACTFTNNAATGAAAGVGGSAGGLLGSPGLPGESGDGVGAAVAGRDAKIQVSHSTFVVNKSTGANGLNGNTGVGRNSGGSGLVGGDAAGGAIYYSADADTSNTNLWVMNSTFFRNSSTSGRGGNGGAGSSEGIGGYDGGQGGNGGFATGGAVDSGGRAFIQHCTFSENTVTGGAGGTGGAAGGSLAEAGESGSKGAQLGGAIYGSSTTGAQVFLVNSILSVSNPSISGAVDDGGGNLSSDVNALLDSPESLKGTNSFLRPLANNGGPTATIAILTNSPAANRGVLEYCLPVDQRGSNRVDRCDSGAYELPLPTIPPEVVGTNSFTLTRTNQAIVLQWPAGFTNLFLQANTNLAQTNGWVTVTNGITYSTNRNSFKVSPTNSISEIFYRLSGLTGHGNGGGGIPPLPEFPPFPQ